MEAVGANPETGRVLRSMDGTSALRRELATGRADTTVPHPGVEEQVYVHQFRVHMYMWFLFSQ